MTLAEFYAAVKQPCETDPPCLGCRVEAEMVAILTGHVPTVEAFTATMQEGRDDEVTPETERLAEIYQRMQTVVIVGRVAHAGEAPRAPRRFK